MSDTKKLIDKTLKLFNTSLPKEEIYTASKSFFSEVSTKNFLELDDRLFNYLKKLFAGMAGYLKDCSTYFRQTQSVSKFCKYMLSGSETPHVEKNNTANKFYSFFQQEVPLFEEETFAKSGTLSDSEMGKINELETSMRKLASVGKIAGWSIFLLIGITVLLVTVFVMYVFFLRKEKENEYLNAAQASTISRPEVSPFAIKRYIYELSEYYNISEKYQTLMEQRNINPSSRKFASIQYVSDRTKTFFNKISSSFYSIVELFRTDVKIQITCLLFLVGTFFTILGIRDLDSNT